MYELVESGNLDGKRDCRIIYKQNKKTPISWSCSYKFEGNYKEIIANY